MTTLAADKHRAFGADVDTLYGDLPIVATDIVYAGAAVGESSTTGTFQPITSGGNFAGFAVRRCDNATGSAGDKKIRVLLRGTVYLPITGVDNVNDEGATVYASDDDSFTLTSTTTYSAIGKLVSYSGTSGFGTVYFEAVSVRSL